MPKMERFIASGQQTMRLKHCMKHSTIYLSDTITITNRIHFHIPPSTSTILANFGHTDGIDSEDSEDSDDSEDSEDSEDSDVSDVSTPAGPWQARPAHCVTGLGLPWPHVEL